MSEGRNSEADDLDDLESRVESLECRFYALENWRPWSSIAIPWSVGGSIAVVLSWNVHHSISWAALHGFLSWIYVAYYSLTSR